MSLIITPLENWPQAVLRLEYVEDGQENVTMEEANEGEQE